MTNLAQTGQRIRGRFLVSLEYSEYRKLWLATLSSQSAVWALIVARAALVLELTGSPAWTGYVTFAAMIPSILVSPLAGYLSDRFDRRTVLACAYGINLAHSVILAVLVASGAVEAWHVLLLAILNGSARAAQMPSAQALLANLVPKAGILNAVSLYQATQQGSRFVGPFLILVVLWITGQEDWVFFLCAALYCSGLFLILRIRTRSTGVVEKGAGPRVILRNMTAGLQFMYHHALIVSIVLLVVAHCAMTMSFESLFPVLSRDKLGMEDASIMGGTSYLMVGYGATALVTSFALAGVQSERIKGRTYLVMAVLSGLTPIGLALAPNMPLAVLATAGMGLSQGGFMTLSHAMVQTIAPDAIRGRLLGVYGWHIQGFMATFNLVNGTLAGFTGLTAAIVLGAGGVGFLIMLTLSMGRLPLRQLYARGVPAT